VKPTIPPLYLPRTAALAQHRYDPARGETMQLHHRTCWTCSRWWGCRGVAATPSTWGSESPRRESYQHLGGLLLTLLGDLALYPLPTVVDWGRGSASAEMPLPWENLQERCQELVAQLDKFKCFFINNHFTLQG